MTLLTRIGVFLNALDREDFYNFYSLATSMSNPLCGDVIWVDGKRINLKKIVRLVRITVMYPRFNVDYGRRYTKESAEEDLVKLMSVRPKLVNGSNEAKSVDKLIDTLTIIVNDLSEKKFDVVDFKGLEGIPIKQGRKA